MPPQLAARPVARGRCPHGLQWLLLAVSMVCFAASAFAQSELRVTGLPEGAPLTVHASATEHVLLVDLALEPEWHACSPDVGGGQPVGPSVAGGSFVAVGELESPEHADGKLRGEFRLLERYVHPDIAPEGWPRGGEWYELWRDRIVFVESAGFWWIEDPRLEPLEC